MTLPRFTPERATLAVEAAAAAAASDPARPLLHFTPPSGWMNDPNGTIFHDGWYHLFYQHHPYSSVWDSMHWGHARSRDLVHWEHRPVALCPQVERGENHCFSGGATIRPDGTPLIMYTSIGDRPPEQWAALGSPDLDRWQPHPDNPVLTLAAHGLLEVGDWRDPFFFELAGRPCLALGGHADGSPAVLWYESVAEDGSTWRYRGILYRHPESELRSLECPNFFQIEDRWVLCFSAYRPVEYVSGRLDPENGNYHPDVHGIIDLSEDFYATNICRDDRERTILFGWVRGFGKPDHWNGALSIPRVVTLAPDGTLRQNPVPEWERLRGKGHRQEMIQVGSAPVRLCDATTVWELDLCGSIPKGGTLTLRLLCEDSETPLWSVCFSRTGVPVENAESLNVAVPLEDVPYCARVFLDCTVVEIFAGEGVVCTTRVLPSGGSPLYVEIQADGGLALMQSIQFWPLNGQ